MLKQIGIIVSILLLAASIFGCGTPKDKQDTSTPVTGDTQTAVSPTETSSGSSAWGDTGSSGTSTSTAPTSSGEDTTKTGTSVLDLKDKLPDNYPVKIFPIYPGSHIMDVMEAMNSYVVIAFSEDHHSDVIAFYKEVFKSADVTFASEDEISMTSFGTKDGYTYTFDTGQSNEYAGYKTQIMMTFYK